MIFPGLENGFSIFQVFHDFPGPWEPCDRYKRIHTCSNMRVPEVSLNLNAGLSPFLVEISQSTVTRPNAGSDLSTRTSSVSPAKQKYSNVLLSNKIKVYFQNTRLRFGQLGRPSILGKDTNGGSGLAAYSLILSAVDIYRKKPIVLHDLFNISQSPVKIIRHV